MMQIAALWIYSEDRSTFSVQQAYFLAEIGICGDRYAVGGSRQVQFASASVAKELTKRSGACFSRFHANVVLDGRFPHTIKMGDHLQVGEAEIEVTGKKYCHFQECSFQKRDLLCPLLTETFVARVTGSGMVHLGDAVIFVNM